MGDIDSRLILELLNNIKVILTEMPVDRGHVGTRQWGEHRHYLHCSGVQHTQI